MIPLSESRLRALLLLACRQLIDYADTKYVDVVWHDPLRPPQTLFLCDPTEGAVLVKTPYDHPQAPGQPILWYDEDQQIQPVSLDLLPMLPLGADWAAVFAVRSQDPYDPIHVAVCESEQAALQTLAQLPDSDAEFSYHALGVYRLRDYATASG